MFLITIIFIFGIIIFNKYIFMSNEKEEKKKVNKNGAEEKGDPETLNTTDPQEHMEGPLSSLMHKAEHSFDDKVTRKDADKKNENF